MINKKKLHVEIIIADYYKDITDSMLIGASNVLKKNNITYSTSFVNGAFEIPQLIKYKIIKNKLNFFIALGCIIKGQTYHFEVLSNSITKSLLDLSIYNQKTFIANGILNVNKKSQAVARSSKNNNKGTETAEAIISLIKCLI